MSASVTDTLPANFRGNITYQGTHEAVLDRGARQGSRQYGGALTVELTFDGNAVAGRFSGTGGINSGVMSGTRSGSHCRLIEQRAGDVIEGECTRTRFSAEARSRGSRNTMAAAFEARATQFVDAAQERGQRAPISSDRSARAPAAEGSAGRPPAALQHSGMERCWALGFAAPTSQGDLDRIPTIQLLNRGQVMAANLDWYCSRLYYGAAALRNDVQGMAAYSYSFSPEAPDRTPDRQLQVFWCQRAYRAARASGRPYERDAVNYFCPIETIAALMTPAERRANRVSEARAERISAEYQREVEARGRAIWRSLLEPSSSGNRGTCIQRGGGVGNDAQGQAVPC